MILSIITINRNNKDGLKKTIDSVLCQTYREFEFVIVDGASTDGSVEIIKEAEKRANGITFKWKSEPDTGIYNAMNKGIVRASGEYSMILNSGDCLVSSNVIERLYAEVDNHSHPDFIYGNMIKVWPDGRKYRNIYKKDNDMFTMYDFYRTNLDHDGAMIHRQLYQEFGGYDENLKIVSDWKWVSSAITFHNVKPVYVDIDVILFDMTGISENTVRGKALIRKEREMVLREALPPSILSDYKLYGEDIDTMRRLHRHPWAYKITWFLERVCFKFEKWEIKRKCFFR